MSCAATRNAALRRAMLTKLAMAAPLLLLLAVLLIYPVGQLLFQSIHGDGGFSLRQYRQLFESSVYVNVLAITLKISFVTTIVCVCLLYTSPSPRD